MYVPIDTVVNNSSYMYKEAALLSRLRHMCGVLVSLFVLSSGCRVAEACIYMLVCNSLQTTMYGTHVDSYNM